MFAAVCAKSRTVAGSPLMSTSGSEMPSFMVALLCLPASRKPKPDFARAPSRNMRRNTDVDSGAGVELQIAPSPRRALIVTEALMGMPDEPYYTIVVETYRISGSGLHGDVHVRPVAGEQFPQTLHVRSPKEMRRKYP